MAEIEKMMNWIDISVPVKSGMAHWPGDIDVSVERVSSMAEGEVCNLSCLHMSAHTGTHMDAPLHFVDGAISIDQMPLDATVGVARVIEIAGPQAIGRAELEPFDVEPGERLIIKTSNTARCWETDEFVTDFVYLSEAGAKYLVDRKVRCVGVDYLSVAGFYQDTVETHVALLGAGIWIMEGLDLRRVAPGHYDLICLPLKLLGADGAPARAILRPIAQS
jgi:arylformamidase